MRNSRRLHVAALAALVVMLLLLVNVRKPAPISNATKFHDIPLLYINDIYVSGHDRPHPEICATPGSNLSLVILITSAPSHSKARDRIRFKWGHYAGVVFAFILGVPDQELLPGIEAEDERHGDIVMGRFVDSYSNLTLKTLSILEWVETYCPQASYLLKTDDDMKINVDRLLELIKTPDVVFANRTIWGHLLQGAKPIRMTESSYYLSPLQFPETVYPDYIKGGGYLMTTDCVHSLRELSLEPNQPYIRMEDAFFTGMLASRLHIKRIHVPDFYGKTVIPMYMCLLNIL